MKSPIYLIQKLTGKKFVAMSSVSLILATVMNMEQILSALAIIIITDMFTGIRKDLFLKKIRINFIKKEFWRAIKSSGIRATWRKTYEYVIGILVFVVLDSLVLKASNFELIGSKYTLSEIAVAIACFVEIYSIYENMEAVSGNNLFKKIISFLPEKFKSLINQKK